jgi:ubiquinone/menaquinone biosynthesis C-methylase UbiE/uncharacterized protein YbaR (Trm112 family)
MNSTIDYIVCPQCKTQLQNKATKFVCENCQRQFACRHGIPILCDLNDKNYYTTVAERLILHIDDALDRCKQNDKIWRQLLSTMIQFYSNVENRNRIILNLVDESKTAFKFFLNISPHDHVLNLGPGWDNTTVNLARSAARVTALDLDLYRLYVLMLKKQCYALDNIDLICAGTERYLPIQDQTLDAVFVHDSLKWSILPLIFNNAKNQLDLHSEFSPLLGFLREINRILKPQGELFWGIRGYFNRRSFKDGVGKIMTQLPETAGNRRFVKLIARRLKSPKTIFPGKQDKLDFMVEAAGFQKGPLYVVQPNYDSPKRITELPKDKDVAKFFKPMRRIKTYFAHQKNRHSATYIGYATKKMDSLKSWMTGMLADLSVSDGFNEHRYVLRKIRVSRKGKFIVFVAKVNTGKNALVIKVPFHETSRSMLERNHTTLKMLHKIKTRLSAPNPFLQAIPVYTYKGDYNGQTYFAEAGVMGTAWGHAKPVFSENSIWRHMLEILQSMNQLPAGEERIESIIGQYEQKLDCLESIIDDNEKRAKQAFNTVKDRVISSLYRAGRMMYFRKGDFSMNNVMVGSERKLGLIDFDEAGYTPFKAVNLADILFSYVRVRKKINRELFLKAMINFDYKRLSLQLKTDDILAMLDADEEELKSSALVSWLDHVYYAIQFEPIKYRKYILNKSFSNTLVVLDSVSRAI